MIKKVSDWFKKANITPPKNNMEQQPAEPSQTSSDNFDAEHKHSSRKSYEKKTYKNRNIEKFESDVLVQVERDDHELSRNDISPNALKVLHRLQSNGFEAYLVGGCVRDLLLDLHPKDFDVVTNATPEQVNQLFSNSRIIGRRFKLIHVTFGRELIEVATFRANHQEDSNHNQSSRSSEGMLLRDNVYGTIDDDAMRRDFTINAMYYTSKGFVIRALPQGLEDLKNKQIRMIGDASARYREDPVRMIRAVRFAIKLGFEIEPETANPIYELADLMANIPPARLFDESLKLILNGKGLETFEMLLKFDLFRTLYPQAQKHIDDDPEGFNLRLFKQALINTDKRINSGKSITPAFILAVFLWPELLKVQQSFIDKGVPAVPAMHQACQKVLTLQAKSASIPKRFSFTMRDIWDLQMRLPRRFGKRAEQILEHQKFRAGFDFVLLREEAGEDLSGLGAWWQEFQFADKDRKHQMTLALEKDKKKRPPRRSKPKKA
ncbi:polynucleotide adenylyltransferase PcnB [Marinicellulosiphila megalodicopiae]|uniref:polynucleotide adenylyltransferase PcnB n=1 Tax=Marinicellulosiphila megalodicopiae TaxID=2724896 RepID=UPI003BB03090